LEFLHQYADDSFEYELTLNVIDSSQSRTVAVIRRLPDNHTIIWNLETNGLIGLGLRLREKFLLLIFRLLRNEMVKAGGNAVEWHMNDAAAWIRRQFNESEAETIFSVLSPHVGTVAEFKSWLNVRVG
jgi:hypothetical protein